MRPPLLSVACFAVVAATRSRPLGAGSSSSTGRYASWLAVSCADVVGSSKVRATLPWGNSGVQGGFRKLSVCDVIISEPIKLRVDN